MLSEGASRVVLSILQKISPCELCFIMLYYVLLPPPPLFFLLKVFSSCVFVPFLFNRKHAGNTTHRTTSHGWLGSEDLFTVCGKGQGGRLHHFLQGITVRKLVITSFTTTCFILNLPSRSCSSLSCASIISYFFLSLLLLLLLYVVKFPFLFFFPVLVAISFASLVFVSRFIAFMLFTVGSVVILHGFSNA